MKPTKWTSLATVLIGSLLTTMSCKESNVPASPVSPGSNRLAEKVDQINGRVTDYSFDGTEGDPIPLTLARSWVANYSDKNQQGIKSHFFGAEALRTILAGNSCMGIRIYYSLDDAGKQELLLLGADGNGRDFTPKIGNTGTTSVADLESSGTSGETFDGSEGASVAEEIFTRWVSNYAGKNPTGLTAHFFGTEILNQILGEDECVGIRMYYALNNTGVQQILLVGVTAKGVNLLPNAQEGGKLATNPVIGDVSFPCPTYCSIP